MTATSMHRHLFRRLLILSMLWIPAHAWGQTSTLIYESEDGTLTYTPYANVGEEDTVNLLPDFSWVGYRFSEVPIPDVPAVFTIEAQAGDNRTRIQSYIDQIARRPLDENGFRGALELKAGYYEVSGPLYIRTSGIVIRGEGQAAAESGGTQIMGTGKNAYNLFNVIGGTDNNAKTGAVRLLSDVPTGTRTLVLASADGFNEGDLIHILRTPNDRWIDDIGMREYYWEPASYNIAYERRITSIRGDTITVDVPMVQALTETYGLGEVYRYDASFRIRNIGIEHLYITSTYLYQDDEKHLERAVYFNQVEDAWVRGVTARNVMRGTVTIDWGFRITVEDCALVDPISKISGSRRYSFEINKGSFNLFQRIYTRNGRHDQVTGSRVAGPNVYVDNYSENTHAETGPHFRYATGLLLDNVVAGDIRVRNRGFTSSGAGHGWSGAQVMFWNVQARQGYEVYVSQPAGSRSWAVGAKGKRTGNGFFELNDQDATPRSLFHRQLQERIGKEAVDAMTTQTQKDGTILESIRVWKGESALDPAWATSTEGAVADLPERFHLEQNRPNPFNPTTRIRFTLNEPGHATLDVFNVLGRRVAQPVAERLPAGEHDISFSAAHLPNGMYFYTLTDGYRSQTKAMVLLK